MERSGLERKGLERNSGTYSGPLDRCLELDALFPLFRTTQIERYIYICVYQKYLKYLRASQFRDPFFG